MSETYRLRDLVDQVVDFINITIPVLIGFALLFFFFSLIRYISRAGNAGSRSADHKAIMWGLIAIFVMVSIWGILRLFQSIFFPDAPTTNDYLMDCWISGSCV